MATTQPTSVPSPMFPQQAYTTPPNSQGHSQSQLQQSPTTSGANLTPSTQSPSSFHNHSAGSQLPLAQRQIRPPKSPMYIPAALRPTDRPNRASPLTPPRSIHGSTDSLQNPSAGPARSSTDPATKSKQPSEPTPEEVEDMCKDLPRVTGPPTHQHWKRDANAIICDGPTCQKGFGWFQRRHHCRHCGNVFCDEHSNLQVPLDQDAEYHPLGSSVRSCEHCRARYDEWVAALRALKQQQREGNASGGDAESAVKLIAQARNKVPEGQKAAVAGSVSRDWNWSTF